MHRELLPENYLQCCALLNNGNQIEYDPAAANVRVGRNEKLRRTEVAFKIIFGERPPPEFWPYTSGVTSQMFVSTLSGKHLTFDVNSTGMTVERLKEKIQVI